MKNRIPIYTLTLLLIMTWAASSFGGEMYKVTVAIPGLTAAC